jgi:nitric-oxide synthase, plant
VAGQGTDVGPAARAKPGLVSPDALRRHLQVLKDKHVLVVLLVDATDFSGSFLPKLRDAVGKNPVLLVVTKADLLPRGTDDIALARWIEDEVGHRRLTLAGLHLVSSRTGDGMSAAVSEMVANRRGRDVVVVGAANVGKSSFIRAAMDVLRKQGDVAAPSRRLPMASPMPGTTLGVIPLRAFDGKATLYDTPGVVLHHRVNGMLDGPDLAALAPRQPLRSREIENPDAHDGEDSSVRLKGLALFWEALARVDVVNAPPSMRLLFWGPCERARVQALSMADADKGQTPWDEVDGAEPPIGAAAVAARGGLRIAREVDLMPGSRFAPIADISISGLGGWITVVAGGTDARRGTQQSGPAIRLRVWVPRGSEVFVRPPMPVQPRGFW